MPRPTDRGKMRISARNIGRISVQPVAHSRIQGDLTKCVCGHSANDHAANSPVIADADWPCIYKDCHCKNWTQDGRTYRASIRKAQMPRPVAAPKHGTQVRYAVCKNCNSRILWNNLDRNWYHSATNQKRCGNDFWSPENDK